MRPDVGAVVVGLTRPAAEVVAMRREGLGALDGGVGRVGMCGVGELDRPSTVERVDRRVEGISYGR
jgi:hypothetical protein